MSALPRRGDPLRALARPGGLAALAVTAFAALLSVQAADGPWLAELGRTIASRGGIPDGVPYATAPTAGWPNVPVLGELVFALLGTVGSRGLQIAQVAAVAGTLALLRATRGAPARRSARSRSRCCCSCRPASGRSSRSAAQLFSLPLFAACVLLLRAETREPSRRIWLLVPLLALWGNLHGAVLTGAAVAGAYLVFERGRAAARRERRRDARLRARAVRQSRALEHARVRARRAAQPGGAPGDRPLGAAQPAQLAGRRVRRSPRSALLAGAAARAPARCGRSSRSAGLALLTLHAARGGMWLALFAVPLAAAGFGGRARSGPLPRLARPVALALRRGRAARRRARAARRAARRRDSRRARWRSRTARRCSAEDLLAEQVADAGGRVWVSNPIDAFSTADQRVYVEWLRGLPAGDAALAHAPRAVLVRRGRQGRSPAAQRKRASAASPPTRAPCSTSASPSEPAAQAASCQASTSTSLALGVGQHVQRERAQVVIVDEQLERVVPGLVEAHAVHLQDQRRRADRHARERRVAGREAALQGRHAVAAVLVHEVELERVLAGLGGVRLEAHDEHHRRVDERERGDVDRVELAEDVELSLARDVGRVAEDGEVDIHASTTLSP